MTQTFEFRLKVSGPDFSRDFTIPLGESFIGREASCTLQLPFPLVSRRHARLVCTETSCEISDLESANGTIVNDVKLVPNTPTLLEDKARIQIGPFDLICEKSPLEAPPEAVAEAPLPGTPEPVKAPPPSAVELVEEKAEEAPAPQGAPRKTTKPEKPAPSPVSGAPAEVKEPVARKPVPTEKKGDVPPSFPPPPTYEIGQPEAFEPQDIPLGLSTHSMRFLQFLPGIYHTDFMSRFLALFESILVPIEWNVDNFDLYLNPGAAPIDFLPWLANWFEIAFDATWSEEQRRTLLKEAHQIYARRGTRWALSRVLEIYTGQRPEIVEFSDPREPFTFVVKISRRGQNISQELIERIIDSSKPAHTSYSVQLTS